MYLYIAFGLAALVVGLQVGEPKAAPARAGRALLAAVTLLLVLLGLNAALPRTSQENCPDTMSPLGQLAAVVAALGLCAAGFALGAAVLSLRRRAVAGGALALGSLAVACATLAAFLLPQICGMN